MRRAQTVGRRYSAHTWSNTPGSPQAATNDAGVMDLIARFGPRLIANQAVATKSPA